MTRATWMAMATLFLTGCDPDPLVPADVDTAADLDADADVDTDTDVDTDVDTDTDVNCSSTGDQVLGLDLTCTSGTWWGAWSSGADASRVLLTFHAGDGSELQMAPLDCCGVVGWGGDCTGAMELRVETFDLAEVLADCEQSGSYWPGCAPSSGPGGCP